MSTARTAEPDTSAGYTRPVTSSRRTVDLAVPQDSDVGVLLQLRRSLREQRAVIRRLNRDNRRLTTDNEQLRQEVRIVHDRHRDCTCRH